MKRIAQKYTAFCEILKSIASLSTSSRLKVGAISLKSDFSKIASFGYNGNYPNAPISPETGTEEESKEPGCDGYIHAEINMVAKFREHDPENYVILLTHSPCKTCSKVLVTAGFKQVYWMEDYRETAHLSEIFDRNSVTHGNVLQLINKA
jgi:dCMP deaminase